MNQHGSIPSVPSSESSSFGYILAFILFIIGNYFTYFIGINLYNEISGFEDNKFIAPGSIIVNHNHEKFSTYTIWNEIETVFNGVTYSSSEAPPPSLRITARNLSSGEDIPVVYGGGARVSLGSNTTRISFGSIEFEDKGSYEIMVQGDFPDRIMSVRPSLFPILLNDLVVVVILLLCAWIIAPIIVVIVFIRNRGQQLSTNNTQTYNISKTPQPEQTATIPSEDRSIASITHLSGFLGMVIPLGSLIGPLLLWSIYHSRSEFINTHGKEALNFQINMMIYGFIVFILMFMIIGFLLLPILFFYWIIMMIMATVAAQSGKNYRYPYTLRIF